MTVLAERAAPTFRLALDSDIDVLVEMVEAFVEESQYRRYTGSDPATLQRTIRWMIGADEAAIFVAEREGVVIGMLGIAAFPHLISGKMTATELFWWLDPTDRGHGGWLLRRAESWARSKGCVVLQMIAPADKPRVSEMYTHLGYEAVETAFQKDLT